MRLNEAIQKIKDTYGEPDETLSGSVSLSGTINIYSGGERKIGAAIPALYSSKDVAVQAWLDAFHKLATVSLSNSKKPSYRFLGEPELDTYRITMEDRRATHRLVDDCHTVCSRVVFG